MIDTKGHAVTFGRTHQLAGFLDGLGRSISDGPVRRLLRPVAYTKAPALLSSTAIARPAPRVAPATSATFPWSEWSTTCSPMTVRPFFSA